MQILPGPLEKCLLERPHFFLDCAYFFLQTFQLLLQQAVLLAQLSQLGVTLGHGKPAVLKTLQFLLFNTLTTLRKLLPPGWSPSQGIKLHDPKPKAV